uniref:Uncharacterized protein n=1 Tax=Ditylenchus dipsaci TaxID=166011 RepID=A0A915EU64_9BILA
MEGLDPDWKAGVVTAENKDGQVYLSFSDKIPDYLKDPNDWVVLFTDDQNKPLDTWSREESGGRPLTTLQLAKTLEPGGTYYMAVETLMMVLEVLCFHLWCQVKSSVVSGVKSKYDRHRMSSNLLGEPSHRMREEAEVEATGRSENHRIEWTFVAERKADSDGQVDGFYTCPASLPLIEANNAEKSAGVSCAASSDDELVTALEISDAKLSPKPNSNVQNTPVVVSVVELNSDTAEKYKESMTVPLVNDDVVGELVDPKKSKYAFPDTPSLIGITNSKIEQSTIKVSSPNHKIYRASSPPFGLSPINSGTKSACSSPGQTKADAVTPKGAEDVLVKTSVREPLVICNGLK